MTLVMCDVSDEEMPSLEFVNKIPFLGSYDKKNDINENGLNLKPSENTHSLDRATKVRSRFLSPKNIKERIIEKEYALYRKVMKKEMSSNTSISRNITHDRQR